MMWRLRDRLLNLQNAMFFRFRRGKHSPGKRRDSAPVIRGNMRRMLVLEPHGAIFSQAVFVLKDDYFQTPGLSRQELLRQAKTAAEEYIDTVTPSGGSTPLLPSAASVFVLGAACAVLTMWLAGLIG